MEGSLATLRVTNPKLYAAIGAPQDVAAYVPEGDTEDELDLSENKYIPASQNAYPTLEDLQNKIDAALKV